ncbi:MAG TPA: hypothetical protein VNF73_13745, partial [Candidatus Saccharimonadales bacterium]|nr:hypothetical protein [Candidatus Saccharimonadales bacterium]
VTSGDWVGGTLHLNVAWPPGPDRSNVLGRVLAAMRSVPQMSLVERVTSGPGHSGSSTYQLSGQTFIADEPYAAGVAADVHAEGPTSLTLFVPGSWIWVSLKLDAEDRIASEIIVDPGHLIERTFAYP